MAHAFAPDRYDKMQYRRCGRSGTRRLQHRHLEDRELRMVRFQAQFDLLAWSHFESDRETHGQREVSARLEFLQFQRHALGV